MRRAVYLTFCLLVVACSDPLDQIPRLSDQDLADEPPQVGLVQMPDVATGDGFLARLLNGNATSKATTGATADKSDESRKAAQPTSTATATSEIAPGTVLPYGQVARICGLAPRAMGKRVQQYPEKRPVYALYDSAPGETGPHSFYVTGFGDGCAQQFTASLVMFGSAGLHEQLRYGLPAKVQPYSDADMAYEKVKSKVCRVGRKAPCGASLSKLEKDTVFLSIYKNFGGNTEWPEMLLHGRKMVALSHKGG